MKNSLIRSVALALSLGLAAAFAPASLALGADSTAQIPLDIQEGDSFTATLRLADGISAAALRCAVGYDQALLTLQSTQVIPAGNADLSQGVGSYKATALREGQARMLWYDLDNSYTGGDLLTLTFTANTALSGTRLTLTGLDLADRAGKPLSVSGAGFSVTVPPAGIPGDANGDGSVNVFDLAALQKHIAGTGTVNTALCELNGDGIINIFDLATLQKGIAGLTTLTCPDTTVFAVCTG